MKKLVGFIFLIFGISVFGQDVHFRQINTASIYNNPAFTGTSNAFRITGIYRNQWPDIDAYETYFGTYDLYIPKLKGGIGLISIIDLQAKGVFTEKSSYLSYSFHTKLKSFVIRPGLSLGIKNNSIDYNKLTFADQIDPKYGFINSSSNEFFGNTSKSSFDISTGILVYNKNLFFSSAVAHINQPDVGTTNTSILPLKWQIQFGGQYSIPEVENLKVTGKIFYQNQGGFNNQQLSFGINYKPVVIQLAHNMENMLALGAGLRFKHFNILYSFEKHERLGKSHEISVQFLFVHRKEQKLGEDSYDFFSFY